MDRVNSEVQAVVSQFLNLHRDQFLPNILTVTNVEVSHDLQHAKIWISVIGKHINETDLRKTIDHLDNDLQDAKIKISAVDRNVNEADLQNKLEHLRRDLQSEINRKLAFKFTPIVEFVLDKSGEYAEKIDQILKKIEK